MTIKQHGVLYILCFACVVDCLFACLLDWFLSLLDLVQPFLTSTSKLKQGRRMRTSVAVSLDPMHKMEREKIHTIESPKIIENQKNVFYVSSSARLPYHMQMQMQAGKENIR